MVLWKSHPGPWTMEVSSWSVDYGTLILVRGLSTYLLTPCRAAAVDKLTPTSLARLQLQRPHALHLGLQFRLLLAGFM